MEELIKEVVEKVTLELHHRTLFWSAHYKKLFLTTLIKELQKSLKVKLEGDVTK